MKVEPRSLKAELEKPRKTGQSPFTVDIQTNPKKENHPKKHPKIGKSIYPNIR